MDIGAGSGRDMIQLLKQGYDVFGIEPCDELRKLAIDKYPNLSSRLVAGNIPDIGKPFGGDFDGVLCSAVIMHIHKEYLFDSVFAIRNILKNNGRLLLSIPSSRSDVNDEQQRDSFGRLFLRYEADYLQLVFERIGFKLIGKWEDNDGLGRENYSWTTLLFQSETSQGIRPIDKIEGVLNRDRKTATYKLALFRALCDIALTNFQQAKWFKGGLVGIPIDYIIEKWIIYYWPIIESPKFIPQIRGESQTSQKPIAFRPKLNSLIDYYCNSGGIYGFFLDYRSSGISEETSAVLVDVFKIIKRTIVNGPVFYAGGSLRTGRIFSYDSEKEMILVDADIWRELSLMGHWINDALILRWAELTSDISSKSIRPSEIIDLLLTIPFPERDTENAKNVYLKTEEKVCVWSGMPLGNKFEIDHVIPFSFWRNNDLWNLLPVSSSVNRKKSDKLPTYNLLKAREGCIVEYWNILRNANKPRFDHEVSKFVGIVDIKDSSWESQLFNNLMESVEVTAIQRGCERWEP